MAVPVGIPAKHQVAAILHFLDRHKSRIKEKVDASLKDAKLTDDKGVDALLAFFKDIYQKDSLLDG